MNKITESLHEFDLSKVGCVADLDNLLRGLPDFQSLSIEDIRRLLINRPDIIPVIIGLWSFDFLKQPEYVGRRIKGYSGHSLLDAEVVAVAEGLVSVIQHCRIECEDDRHAIDYHYAACCRLFRLLGDNAELVICDEIQKQATLPLIEALGVLVGHEVKGSLTDRSIALLKEIAEINLGEAATFARRVLTEDIARANKAR